MKKLLFLFCSVLLSNFTYSQNCLPEGIRFTTQAQIDNFSIDHPDCTGILGSVNVSPDNSDTDNITNLSGLSQLNRIFGNFTLDRVKVKDLKGLNNLKRIDGIFRINETDISDLKDLDSIEALPNLEITSNNSFVSLEGIPADKIVSLSLIDNSSFSSIIGLEDLQSPTYLEIKNCPIKNFEGLNSLKEFVGGQGISFKISNCQSLENFVGLNSLETIDNALLIENCQSLKDFTGLETLTKALFVRMFDLRNLESFKGFENLTEVYQLHLENIRNITDIAGFNSLTTAQMFTLRYVRQLEQITGFNSLRHVEDLTLQWLPLETLNAFNQLTSASSITLEHMDDLKVINGFDIVTDVHSLTINNNRNLQTFHAFNNCKFTPREYSNWRGRLYFFNNINLLEITNIGSGEFIDLELRDNFSLRDISGLSRLDGMLDPKNNRSHLEIIANRSLTSLEALENFTKLPTEVTITKNTVLEDCPSKFMCQLAANNLFGFDVSENAEGCNKDDFYQIGDTCSNGSKIITENCECETEEECIVGETCDDENPETTDDVYSESCVCTGTPLDEMNTNECRQLGDTEAVHNKYDVDDQCSECPVDRSPCIKTFRDKNLMTNEFASVSSIYNDIVRNSAGDYILAGGTQDFGDGGIHYKTQVIKYNSSLDLLWETFLFQNKYGNEANHIINTSDEGVFLTGRNSLYAKLDKDGNILWKQDPQEDTPNLISAVELNDGSILIISSDFTTTQLDKTGQVINQEKIIDGVAESMIHTSDDHVIISGKQDNRALLIKLDNDLNIVKSYKSSVSSTISNLSFDRFNNILGIGHLNAVGNFTANNKYLFYAKFDQDLNLLWNFENTSFKEGKAIKELPDGNLILLANDSEGGTSRGNVVIYTDNGGNVFFADLRSFKGNFSRSGNGGTGSGSRYQDILALDNNRYAIVGSSIGFATGSSGSRSDAESKFIIACTSYCDDGDYCTQNDQYDENCECKGSDVDNDGEGDQCDSCDNRLVGTSCDDDNPETENDVFLANCSCQGTPISIMDKDDDGIPDAEDNCPDTYNSSQIDSDNDGIGDQCEFCPIVSEDDCNPFDIEINEVNTDGDNQGIWLTNGYTALNSIINLADGGYAVTGGFERPALLEDDTKTAIQTVRLNENGDLIWNKILFGNDSIATEGNHIIETLDGGFFVCGIKSFVKLNSNGDILWQQPPQNDLPTFTAAVESNDGSIYIISRNNTLTKLSADGNELWAKPLGEGSGNDMLLDSENVLFISGSFPNGNLLKVDIEGNVVGNNEFQYNSNQAIFNDITLDSKNNLLATGYLKIDSFTAKLIYAKLDKNFNVLWVKTNDINSFGQSIKESSNGNIYVLSNNSRRYSTIESKPNTFTRASNTILVLNSEGETLNIDAESFKYRSRTYFDGQFGGTYSISPRLNDLEATENIGHIVVGSVNEHDNCYCNEINHTNSTIIKRCIAYSETKCDDGDPCTENDIYNDNCECIGTIIQGCDTNNDDQDGDQVADQDDNCLNIANEDQADTDQDGIGDACDDCDNTLSGKPCDDNNPNTENDTYDSDCNCTGTPISITDRDDDGIPDEEDNCPDIANNSQTDSNNNGIGDKCEECTEDIRGAQCDDYNELTEDDRLDFECNCVGRFKESISGNIYHDLNENGKRENGEPGLGKVKLYVDGAGQYIFTNDDGVYSFRGDRGNYIIRPEMDDCWELTSNARFAIVNYQGQSVDNIDFGYRSIDDNNSLRTIIASGKTKCNREVPFWINMYNSGCSSLDLRLELSYNELVEYKAGASPLPSSKTSNTISWEFENAKPRTNSRVKLNFTIGSEEFEGERIELIANIYQNNIDGEDELIDTRRYISKVKCAVDPNDKLVYPFLEEQQESNYTLFEDELDYTIRFQNTGNDTAEHITVRDTLPEGLDWSTFIPGASSHTYTASISEEGLVAFEFRNIMLPDSITDLNGSQGFVNFFIKPLQDLEEFEEANNNAGIFFDFNKPVITNSVKSTFVSTFDADLDGSPFWEDCDDNDETIYPGAQEIANNDIDEDCSGADFTSAVDDLSKLGFKVYPIPTRDEVYIDADKAGTYDLILFDMVGKIVFQENMTGQKYSFNTNSFPEGAYILLITDNVKKLTGRKRLVILK